MRYVITLANGQTVAQTDHLDIAETLREHTPFPVRVLDNWTNTVVTSPVATDNLPWRTIDQFIREGKKIPAIKLVRELTSLSLGEAKGIVDKRAVVVEKTECDRHNHNAY